MMRWILLSAALLCVILLVLPAAMVQVIGTSAGQMLTENEEVLMDNGQADLHSEFDVHVYRTEIGEVEQVPLEQYVVGVVASEMPAEFEMEALKAQAIAARTYIIRRLVVQDFGDTPTGSVVMDNVKHQVYQNEHELHQRFGSDYDRHMQRIQQAVKETEGQVITYQGKPIDASYFSTSNGHTESSEHYWDQEIPYLRGVESPWDVESPRYHDHVTLDIRTFQDALGLDEDALAVLDTELEVSHTPGGRVHEISIGDVAFSGREFREMLDLYSADFEVYVEENQVRIETTGYGHGVGMSQWGANGMASEGKNAADIINHYYTDVQIQDYRQWVVKK